MATKPARIGILIGCIAVSVYLTDTTSAQLRLGVAYWQGEGVPRDYVLSYMWLNLSAASKESDAAKARDELAEHMTPEQLAEAQKLSREWMQHHAEPEPPVPTAPTTD